nr:hypothetical protein [Nitrospirota bacterium]
MAKASACVGLLLGLTYIDIRTPTQPTSGGYYGEEVEAVDFLEPANGIQPPSLFFMAVAGTDG